MHYTLGEASSQNTRVQRVPEGTFVVTMAADKQVMKTLTPKDLTHYTLLGRRYMT